MLLTFHIHVCAQFGGGRTIHPGEQLETPEEKAASEARIRESVAKYESRIGLNIDAKIKKKCEKVYRIAVILFLV